MTFSFSRKLGLPTLTLASLVGCSQILGLSDYDIDPKLDDSSGGSAVVAKGGSSNGGGATAGGEGGFGGNDAAAGSGASTTAGMPAGGAGGEGGGGREIVPCDSAACCVDKGGEPVGVELLGDGGFELGPVRDALTPWTQASTNNEQVITNNLAFGWKPKSGNYFAYLSGIAGETSTLYSEDLVLEESVGWVVLSGYRLSQIDSKDAANEDYSGIGFYGYANEDPEELPFFWATPGPGSLGFGGAAAWTLFEASWDAAPHVGQKRYLGIRGSSDLYYDDIAIDASSYLYDDVSLKAFSCVK